jgi:hypothetical protein
MTGAELEGWFIGYGYGDEQEFGDCFENLKQSY